MLLIEDELAEIQLLTYLLEQTDPHFVVTPAMTLKDGIASLAKATPDAILLDLLLPDSQGLESFSAVSLQAPTAPVVILTALDDETNALEAVRKGAQDYLVKGTVDVDGKMLSRVLRYAIERNQMQMTLRGLSLIDELTGLYNRRGFLTLAAQQIALSHRAKRTLILLFADLDGLKQINDTFGHQAGDQTLLNTAEILKEAFRSSDIIARIGGDEFAILALEAQEETVGVLTARLLDRLKLYNAQALTRYPLSLSFGVAVYSPQHHQKTLEQLMVQADAMLYTHKREKRVLQVSG